jgi:hypothetical protein
MKERTVICKEVTQNVCLVEVKLKDEIERRMKQTKPLSAEEYVYIYLNMRGIQESWGFLSFVK